nr:ribonuclease H-like domain-containing protein [Tanacetum cinerariifolium]
MSDHEDETITEENAHPKVVPQITTGNSAKFMITDNDGNLKIRPLVTAEEHQQVQGEEKFLEIDTKGYSSSSSTLSNAVFVSTAESSQGNLSYQESGNGGYTTTLSVSPGSSSSNGSSKSKCSVVDDVHRFEKKHGRKIKFNGRNNAWFDKKLVKCFNYKQMGHFSRECQAQVVSANDVIPAGVSVSAGNVVADVVSPQSETEFALMGLSTK